MIMRGSPRRADRVSEMRCETQFNEGGTTGNRLVLCVRTGFFMVCFSLSDQRILANGIDYVMKVWHRRRNYYG